MNNLFNLCHAGACRDQGTHLTMKEIADANSFGRAVPLGSVRPAEPFFVNGIAVDITNHCLGSVPKTTRVEPKVMALLVTLATNPHELVRREELLERIWPNGLGGDESLTRLVYQLRRAFRSFPELDQSIVTVSKSGYRLEANVASLDVASPDPPAHGGREYHLSVAVLPVTDQDQLPDNGYLADGMSRDLTSCLATTPMLFVTPYSSVLALHDPSLSLDAAAQAIGCRFILSGNFRRRGNQITLRFELVDTLDASLAWSGKYNTELDQFFDVQDDVLLSVSTAISTQIRFPLSPPELQSRPFKNDIYRILQAAETLRYRYGKDTALEIVRLCREGLAIDPDHAVLRASLAVQLSQNVVSQWEADPKAAERMAFDHIERALATEPGNPDVIAGAGIVNAMFHRPKEALVFLRRALARDPNKAHALAMLGWQTCLLESDPAGIRLIESAEQRAPHHPRYGLWATYRATDYLFMLDYAAAVPACEQAILRTPNYYQPRLSLAWALTGLGKTDLARSAIRGAETFEGNQITGRFVDEMKQWSRNSPNAAECAKILDKLIPFADH